MQKIIETTVDTVYYYFKRDGKAGSLYRIVKGGDGKIGLKIGNFDILFPLYEIKQESVIFDDNKLEKPLKELLDRIYNLEDINLKQAPLSYVLEVLIETPWTELVEDILELPELLREIFHINNEKLCG